MADFSGLRILVVEDEGPIALMIEDLLADLGCEVVASAANLDQACELARTVDIDLALVDLNLHGVSATPVARILRERAVPFIFCTGYGAGGILEEFASCPSLTKPFTPADLNEAIRASVGARAG